MRREDCNRDYRCPLCRAGLRSSNYLTCYCLGNKGFLTVHFPTFSSLLEIKRQDSDLTAHATTSCVKANSF